MICKPITFAMSAPTADGSAAAVVCSKEFMESNQMQVCCDKEFFFYQTRIKFPVGLCKGRDGCNFFFGGGWLGGREKGEKGCVEVFSCGDSPFE